MPGLRNPKHEAFCQLTFEGARYGWSQGLIYVKAGFKATGHAAGLARCSPERVFVELRRIIASHEALYGLELMSTLGATAVVLPELEALRGVEQNRFHHADVYGHTLEVLARTIALTDPVSTCCARRRSART